VLDINKRDGVQGVFEKTWTYPPAQLFIKEAIKRYLSEGVSNHCI